MACLLVPLFSPGSGSSQAAGSAAPAALEPDLANYRIVEQNHPRVVVDACDARVGGLVPLRSDALKADDVVAPKGTNLIHWHRTFSLKPGQAKPHDSQDESVNDTDWGYDSLAQGMDRDAPRGAGQCWLTAWPTAMRLTALSDPDLRGRIETWTVKPMARSTSQEP
jgi:hypothetical protein